MESNRKYPSVIQQIELHDATFAKTPAKESTVTDLTCVNFFFGNNGTGKSTIARAIINNDGVSYNPRFNRDGFFLHVYDENYIRDNIQSYPGMPGLFTMDYVNITTQHEVEKRQAEIQSLHDHNVQISEQKSKKESQLEKLIKSFRKDIWDKTKEFREVKFPDTQKGYRKSQKDLADRILKSEPKDIKEADLLLLYNSAFAEDAKAYPLFESLCEFSHNDSKAWIVLPA